jgi:hypothetical protein
MLSLKKWFGTMNVTDEFKKAVIEQYIRRRKWASERKEIDNSELVVGSPMYFYCKHCGIQSDKLPEDYLFQPSIECSQCLGLLSYGWMDIARLEWLKSL